MIETLLSQVHHLELEKDQIDQFLETYVTLLNSGLKISPEYYSLIVEKFIKKKLSNLQSLTFMKVIYQIFDK